MPTIHELVEGARDALTVRKVFGEPVHEGDVTVIPAARVRGGGGGGGDNQGNGGSGFGLAATPVGAYVVRGDSVSWEPARDPNRIVLGWQLLAALGVFAWWRVARSRSRS